LAIQADPDQLEQLLINIIRNAVDATLDPASSGSSVSITWRRHEKVVSISVLDEGPGILSDKNLFVPFFTTKPGGSGIGLVLSRQIAELHGGTLKLKNRFDRAGCEAELRLPVSQPFSV
jgi:two-component system, NtrC family, nitrogen regulation sensor histidine kinase NtrY